MRVTRYLLGTLLIGALATTAGCPKKPFQMSFPTNNSGAIGRVTKRLAAGSPRIKNALGKPMAFIVATRPRGIVALDLETHDVLWRKNIKDTSSKIVVGKNYLFHRKGSTILMARHLRTGEIAWQYTFKYGNSTEFYGLAADGDDLYYVATTMTGGRMYARFADIVKVDGATGKVQWRKRANGPLGAPAARNGMVFVPYRFQYLSVLDGKTGNERARVKVKHKVMDKGGGTRLSPILINFVRDTPEGLIFGNDRVGTIRFSRALVSGRKKQVDFVSIPLKRQRSVNARYWWDAYKPSMVSYTAIDRNRLHWRFASDAKRFSEGMAVMQYYRYFFGFNASEGVLKWAYMHPATQVISSTHTGEGILYISREGHLVMLDADTGDRIWDLETGIRTHGATFDANGFSPPRRKREKNPPLLTILKKIIDEPDRQFQDAKVFAVTQLVKVKGAEISKILLRIVNDKATPTAVRRVAGRVLVKRANKASLGIFLDALEARYDFLEGKAPKGVGIVARALARVGSPKAVPALLAHLRAPMTPYSALEEIVRALIEIGDKRIVWPFNQFLLTYRAEPAFKPRINILTTIAKALLKMGGRSERQMLTFVAEDHHTLPQLRQFLKRELGKALKLK